MARAPDERIEQAKAMYLKGMKLVEIASQLNLPEGTVRRWKCTHKWDNERSDKITSVRKRKRGGQMGNKNATGPPGNKNAVKTGEFETLFFDTLNQEEKELLNAIPCDKEQLLLQEIQLLTIRERRMLKRIELLKESDELADDMPAGMLVAKYTSGTEKGKKTELKEYQGILGQIQTIEDALTRVQARRQRAIETLHKFGYDDARMELETMKLEFEMLKQDGQTEEQEDDGFMDAMNAQAKETWEGFDV